MASEKEMGKSASDLDSRIEAYLNGEMSPAVRDAFEQEIVTDPQTAALVNAERAIRASSVRTSERLSSIGLAAPSESLVGALATKNRFAITLWYGIAALSLLVGFLLIRGLFQTPETSKPTVPVTQSPVPAAPAPVAVDSVKRDSTPKQTASHIARTPDRSRTPAWRPDATPSTPPLFIDSSIHTR